MRRLRFVVPMMLLCLLTACGGTDDQMQAALDLRTQLLSAGGCHYDAEIIANCGDTAYTFTLACQSDGSGASTFTVTAPESIAGISAVMAPGETTVTYDDMLLVFDSLAAGDVNAAACPGILYSAWTGGYISACGSDEENILATYLLGYDEAELRVDTWLDESGQPLYAEISSGGTVILSCTISDFTYSS